MRIMWSGVFSKILNTSTLRFMPKLNFYQKYQYFHGAGCEQFLTYEMNCYSLLRRIFLGKFEFAHKPHKP